MPWRSLALAAFLLTALVPQCPAQPAPIPVAVPTLTVRGTVEQLDLRHNSFVLRVQTHTRIVYVTEDTDVSGLGLSASNPLPVTPKERVTVGGYLQPNGTVLAGLLTLSIQHDFQPLLNAPNRIVFGTVSSTSNKMRGRDIKVREADGIETKIKVGRGISIARAGRAISVHDLSGHDEVRVIGMMDSTDLKAQRIDALPPLITTVPAAIAPDHAPIQPGL